LLAWLKSSQADLNSVSSIQTRTVPIRFSKTDGDYAVSAGDSVSVKTASLESCKTGACGEALWYTPRTQTSVFTVAVDRSSNIYEPLLKLTWNDAGRKTVFLGKFGDNTLSRSFTSVLRNCAGLRAGSFSSPDLSARQAPM
jgi:hypothetical protein